MQSGKQGLVDFSIYLDQSKAVINGLTFNLMGDNLILHRQNCRIGLPVANIGTVGKNGLSLILFIKDYQRPEEDNWDEEDIEVSEKKEANQYQKMDLILFNMLKGVEKGAAFDNVLKGDFQVQLHFAQIDVLKQLKDQIQAIIRDLQQKKQQPKLSMEAQDEMYEDIQ